MLQFALYVCIYVPKGSTRVRQETGYLLRKRDGVDYTIRSSPVKRWMNKYMGLIIQIKLQHVRV